MQLVTGFALGCLAIVFIIIARDFWHQPVARVFLLMVVSGAGVLIQPLLPPGWQWLAEDFMTAVPALFWLLCQVAFSYRPRLISIWGGIALYSFIPPAFVRSIEPDQASLWVTLCWEYPRYAEYLLTVHGLWTVVANWRDDLVESRRTLRGVVLGSVGSLVLVIIVSMNTGYTVIPVPILVAVASLILAVMLLQGKAGVLLGEQSQGVLAVRDEMPTDEHIGKGVARRVADNRSALSASATQVGASASASASLNQALQVSEENKVVATARLNTAEDSDLLQYAKTLDQLMADGFYRTEKLTIKALAHALDLPEYRTRALINQHLGYRNFNEYINHLRVTEAAHRLHREPDTPVLNISLDVGYRTLSSFNRAFKDQLGCSPSEYRTQRQNQGR